MSQRFTAAQAAKLISEWIDNDDNDSVNLDIDDRIDVSEVDNLQIDDRSDEFYDDLPIATHDNVVAAVDVTDNNEADYENCDTIADDVELTDDDAVNVIDRWTIKPAFVVICAALLCVESTLQSATSV
jgi:hypothetical protein